MRVFLIDKWLLDEFEIVVARWNRKKLANASVDRQEVMRRKSLLSLLLLSTNSSATVDFFVAGPTTFELLYTKSFFFLRAKPGMLRQYE